MAEGAIDAGLRRIDAVNVGSRIAGAEKGGERVGNSARERAERVDGEETEGDEEEGADSADSLGDDDDETLEM